MILHHKCQLTIVVHLENHDIRLAGLVTIVCRPGLAGRDRSVIDQLQQVLAIACNDSKLLTMLAQSIELVRESSLQLLARDVRQLSLSDKRLGLSADKLLLEHDNLGRVGLLVLQLRNLIGDLLLPYSTLSAFPNYLNV